MRCTHLTIILAFLAGLALVPGRLAAQTDTGSNPDTNGLEGAQSPQLDEQAARFGVMPSQTAQIKQAIQQNSLTGAQLTAMCAGVSQRHLSPADVESAASSLGISGAQLDQLKQCTKPGAGQPSSASLARPQGANSDNAALNDQTIPRTPGPESSIEASFRRLANPDNQVEPPSPAHLEQFGYSLFSSKVSTFAPVDSAPVSDDYVIGPGDQLNVLMWGRVNQTLHLDVQRDGSLMLPQLGPIQVAGLNFAQAKHLIEDKAGKITGVQVDVTMGRLRSIQVFVIGQVNHPGLFTVSSLSHVSNALVAAGGISKIGSLRRVELRRNNQLIRVIDLYALLMRGDTSADLQLEPRDVIFVPVIGPVVAISGNAKSPGIYELIGGESLQRALALAGGVGAFGYKQRLQVERVQNHERNVALDTSLGRLSSVSLRVQDGDLIKIFGVLPDQDNIVKLKGNARRPGTYQWRAGMTVSDLIANGEGVADHTYFDYALIKRVEGPDRRVHFLPVNLGVALHDGGVDAQDLKLRPRDELTIYSEYDLQDLPAVTVEGTVRRPGRYPLSAGMKLSDLIYEAGGLKEEAYQERAQLVRSYVANGADTQFLYIDVDLRTALEPNSSNDPPLTRGDDLLIQEASNWHLPWRAVVAGQVVRPGPYPIAEGERLSVLLRQCGGFKPNAFPFGAVFVRQSVKQLQQEELDAARTRLQKDVARLSLMPQQAGGKEPTSDALTAIQSVLNQTVSTQAVGRIAINLNSAGQTANSSSDIVLENGDRLDIPAQPISVQVLGEVYNPNAIVYQPGLTVADYLNRAGGPTDEGDADHIYVVQANGDVLTDEGVRQSGKNRFFPLISSGLMGKRLGPGDTIYVPEKLIYVSGLQYATDITQIVANSATGLAVLGILGSSL
ncbi:MAG TPA: SLBB domain-containing protein [Candidatus Binataceae bacterium]|nr:SLBB domain-containing protein [Candidatus Binataceae bacterium]